MPECARCKDFTDNTPDGDYHYCDACLETFAAVEANGVIVEGESGDYRVAVTASAASLDGGTEYSQVDALARGKHVADEHGLEAVFSYGATGSTWLLEDYLQAHPDIRQDVHERLRRLPAQSGGGLLARLRGLF